ncbi:site-2 protease family protein [Actinorugispora endophytica]|uniref:Zinc metalloprotease n=1 Tax=Actinorugispora endophytica TaxID=1605990 RepID=A0A4R6UJY4_9ACTN|nr:site-2 protease family protein [Actinorugispora endophytica]TDQ45759.1 Zn-dependent protease [Actinorugispora endophytica]
MSGTRSGEGRRGGLLMGRPFGIPVYVTPSWLVIAALITVLYQPVVDRALHLGAASYLVAFVFAVLLYASVLVHELAHCVVARAYGLPVRRVTLYMLGGVSEIQREADRPRQEFWIAFSGPLLSLALAGAGAAAYLVMDPATVAGVLVWQLWVANLLVGVFNLLPGLPLDGGRMLRAGVWAVSRKPLTGTVVAAWGGRLLGAAVVVLPFAYSWTLWRAVPGVLTIVWSVLLGAFIWANASSALKTARMRARVPTLRARSLARRAVLATADTPLAEALRRRGEAGAGAIIVTDSAGTPTSLVNDAAAAAVPEGRRPWVPVAHVARAIVPEAVLSADAEGDELLEAMGARPASEYLLIDSGGTVFGVLNTSDVQDVFSGSGGR